MGTESSSLHPVKTVLRETPPLETALREWGCLPARVTRSSETDLRKTHSMGYLIDASNMNTLVGNTAIRNGSFGFDLRAASTKNALKNNLASYNGGPGGGNEFILEGGSNENLLEQNVAITDNKAGAVDGFLLQASHRNDLRQNVANGNRYGFLANGSNANTFNANRAQGNSVGFFAIGGSSGNTFKANVATADWGFALDSSNQNTFTQNLAKSNEVDKFPACIPVKREYVRQEHCDWERRSGLQGSGRLQNEQLHPQPRSGQWRLGRRGSERPRRELLAEQRVRHREPPLAKTPEPLRSNASDAHSLTDSA